MKLALAILSLGLVSLGATAAPAPLLTEMCKAQLEQTAAGREKARLRREGVSESSINNIVATAWANGTASGTVNVRVRIQEISFEEGRSVSYTGTATAAQGRACNVSIRRDARTACRYSNGSEDGQDLEDIRGLAVRHAGVIRAGARLTASQRGQIRAAFGQDSSESIDDIINGTDDREINYFVVRLPSGNLLDYYKAHGGDNPFGTMFRRGTTTVAGSNSDGDLCVLEGND